MTRSILPVLALALLSPCFFPSISAQVDLTETVRVDDDPGLVSTEWYPSAALAPDGSVSAVWTNESDDRAALFFASKAPDDTLFTESFQITGVPADTYQRESNIVVNSVGDVFVTWVESEFENWKILCARKSYGFPAFESPVVVSDDTGYTEKACPAAAHLGNTFALVWQDHRNGDPDIFCSISTDGGNTFSGNLMVNDALPGIAQERPDVAIDPSGTLYVVWEDERDGSRDIYFSKADSGGFSAGVPVADTTEQVEQRAPSIAAGPGDCVSVAWWDAGLLTTQVLYSKTSDGGVSFSPPVRIYDSMEEADFYTDIIVGTENTVCVAHNATLYYESEQCYYLLLPAERLFYSVSSDSGTTFSSIDVTDFPNPFRSLVVRDPSLMIGEGGTIHMVWADTRNGNSASSFIGENLRPYGFDIFYNTVNPDTLPGAVLRVNGEQLPADHAQPAVAWGTDGKVAVCWSDDRNGPQELFCTVSSDSGETFGASVPVASPGEALNQKAPAIGTDSSGYLHLVWLEQDVGNNGVIRYAGSSDIYSGFSEPVTVTDSIITSISNPGLEVDGAGTINVMWHDARNGNYDVFFSRSTDGGLSFSPDVRVNGDSSDEYQGVSDLAVDQQGDVYAVWIDYRDADGQVFFARTREGSTVFEGEKGLNSDGTGPYMRCTVDVDENGKVYVMWCSIMNLYFSTSTDGGDTFSEQRNVGVMPVYGDPDWCGVRAREGSVIFTVNYREYFDYCTWYHIFLVVSTDGGRHFSDLVTVSDDSTVYARGRDVDVDAEGNFLTVWSDPRRNAHSLYRYDPNRGSLDNIFLRKGRTVVGIGGEVPDQLPRTFDCYQNYPNPFNPVTSIRYDIPEGFENGENVILSVYTVRGRLVRTLVNEPRAPGSHTAVWDGRDDRGEEVSSGVYFYRLETGRRSAVRKMVLVR